MVDRWSGSIELGVTTIGPEEIAFPNTMTDIDYDTWMLSGAAVMQDGATIKNGSVPRWGWWEGAGWWSSVDLFWRLHLCR